MAWVNIAKPTGDSWVSINPRGRESYSDGNVFYDDTITFYDGINQSSWTNISKPIYSQTWDQTTVSWDNYQKQWESPSWTQVPKPTL